MKVLVITRNAWDDSNSIGNTFSNFFEGIDDVEFANIYFRSARPNNKICKNYYHVTETEILKKWFFPKQIGKQFVYNGETVSKKQFPVENKEKVLVNFVRGKNIKLAYRLSNYIWYQKKWINSNLKSFVESFSPDIAITFAKSAPQYFLTVKYLRENFNIPLFTWIADDEYTGLLKTKSKKEIENLRYILAESATVCGCSEEMCKYYNSVFGCKAFPLYKGCEIKERKKESCCNPLKMVYAGNLLYGRVDVIKTIAEALDNISDSKTQVSFEIYSNTQLSSSQLDAFNKIKCLKYMGQKDYETIKECMSMADVVIHAESFEEDQIIKTKYSFSTKIIDCLQSGSVLLAVGPCGISSIDYVRKIPGACVITDISRVQQDLEAFVNDRDSFRSRAEQIHDFAKKYHDRERNAAMIKEAFRNIIERRV